MADYKVIIGADTTQLTQDVTNAINNINSKVTVGGTSSGGVSGSFKQLSVDMTATASLYDKLSDSSANFTQKEVTSASMRSKAFNVAYKEQNKVAIETAKTQSSLVKSSNAELISQEKLAQSRLKTAKMTDTATKANKGFSQSFVDSTKKVLQFGLSTAVIGAMYSAINMAKGAVFEFDDVLTEFSKVSNYSRESIQDYSEELGILGENVAKSRTEMLNSATMFKKSGFSEDEAAQLSEIASMYSNIADSMVGAEEASTFVTSQIRAFDLEASEAIVILDELNAVSNNFGVSSTDLATGLTKNASVLSGLGNEMSETIA